MSFRFFEKAILWVLGFRLVSLLVSSFFPLTLPGVWRQSDTLGVSLRYWLRWTVEHSHVPWLLPAVLQSGDFNGVMPMECPLLNILFAPFWSLGTFWARVFCTIGVLLLNYLLVYWNTKLWKNYFGNALWLLLVASVTSSWTGKFIPDVISVLLVLAAVGVGIFKERSTWSAFLLASLGLLMKPTSIAVLVLLLLEKNKQKFFKKHIVWVGGAVFVSLVYYLGVVKWIAVYQEEKGLFAMGWRGGFFSLLWSVLVEKGKLFHFAYARLFFRWGLFFIVPLHGYLFLKKMPLCKDLLVLWAILFIQFCLISGISGTHVYMHDYYFLSLAPTACWMVWLSLKSLHNKWAFFIVFLLILGRQIELSLIEWKSFYKKEQSRSWRIETQCKILKKRNPSFPWHQGMVFRSPKEVFPTLGLCFGERQNSVRSKVGFFYKKHLIPSGCFKVDQTKDLVLVRCDVKD